MDELTRVSNFIDKTFAFWAALCTTVAFCFPETLKWVTPHIPLLLGIIMFGMGPTLMPSDFKIIDRHPKAVIIGVVSQFVIMPLVACSLAVGLNLPAEIAVGVILVDSCPGGTAFNVIACLTRGNMAPSATVTSITTLLAPIITPFIFWALAHQWLRISAADILVSIMKMVLLLIISGVIAHTLFRRQIEKAAGALPLISVTMIVLIIDAVVDASKPRIIEGGLLIFGVVILHSCIDYLLGFLTAKLCKLPHDVQGALAVEVGVQNSGLGAALVSACFTPLAAVFSAFFGVQHNISSSLLVPYWTSKVEKADPAERQ